MSVSKLGGLYIYDAAMARSTIVEAFLAEHGNGRATAKRLGVDYATLYRMFCRDPELARAISEARQKLRAEGVSLIGVGEAQEGAMEEKGKTHAG